MKCFSLFSGIGGFDLVAQRIGHKIVGACEIDRFARQVYERHFPNVKIWEDATKLKPEELPDFDILCAGFPCQAFSLAGRRLGFEDTRGTLFYEIARIADKKRPRIILLENVKGILYHDEGRTLTTIIKTFYELGYDIEWQVINSKYFVPQNRERIFIIGHLRGEPTRKVFPLTEVGRFDDTTCKETQGERKRIRGELVGAIDANYSKGGGSRTMILCNKSDNQGMRIYDSESISPALGSGHAMSKPVIAIPTLCVNRDNKRQNGRRFKNDGEPMFTITTQDRHGVYDGKNIRSLTPLECERLQGFPDNWTEGIADTHRYHCIGNAVTVPVVQYIFECLTLEKERQP